MRVEEGAVVRNLNLMRMCKKELDGLSKGILEKQKGKMLRRAFDYEDDVYGILVNLVPSMIGWSTILVDEGEDQGYIGLDMKKCIHIKVVPRYDYKYYTELPFVDFRRKLVRQYIGIEKYEEENSQEVKEKFEQLEIRIRDIEERVNKKVEFRVRPESKRLNRGNPKYIPVLRFNFSKGSLEALGWDPSGVYVTHDLSSTTYWKEYINNTFYRTLTQNFPFQHIEYGVGDSWYPMR